MNGGEANILVEHFFRHEKGKLIATLSKLFGLENLQIAEDISQETMLDALTSWPLQGIPDNPRAWLYRVAKNKAIDILKRSSKLASIVKDISVRQNNYEDAVTEFFLDKEIKDNQLQMLFVCCHPSIPEDGQVMFILKNLCGLSVEEIAKAYLCEVDAVEKRVYRVKEKLKVEKIKLSAPAYTDLHTRLHAVLRVIYLLFNEGYNTSSANVLIRKDLCNDAMRLCSLLIDMPSTNLPFTNALMALMCFQSSRFDARLDEEGNIITLQNQCREKWDNSMIQKGNYYLHNAITKEVISKYQIEASIAYWYSNAASFEATNWVEILNLYNLLIQLDDSPMVKLNRLIVLSINKGYEAALSELLQLTDLKNNYLYHSTVAYFYKKLHKIENAKFHLQKAVGLTKSTIEKKLLNNKIEALDLL